MREPRVEHVNEGLVDEREDVKSTIIARLALTEFE